MARSHDGLTDMDWDKLKVFHAAAEAGSFTHAGEQLGLSQSAVSRQVSALEQELSVSLFHRHARGLILTEQGDLLFRTAHDVFMQLQAARAKLTDSRERPSGELKVTTSPGLGINWLIPRLTAFMRLRPDIHVEFLPHRQGYDFSTPELDAAVRFGEGIWPGSGADYIVGREILPVCSPRLIPGGCSSPADLLAYPLLHHTSALEGWRDWFEQAGCDTRRSLEGARFDQYALLSQAAAAGFGVALIPRCLIEDELRDGKLAVAIQLPIRARMGYYLCYPEQKANLPTLQAFRTWLMEVSRAAEPQPQEETRSDSK